MESQDDEVIDDEAADKLILETEAKINPGNGGVIQKVEDSN